MGDMVGRDRVGRDRDHELGERGHFPPTFHLNVQDMPVPPPLRILTCPPPKEKIAPALLKGRRRDGASRDGQGVRKEGCGGGGGGRDKGSTWNESTGIDSLSSRSALSPSMPSASPFLNDLRLSDHIQQGSQ